MIFRMIGSLMNLRKDGIIRDRLRESRNIVYGARAMNVQLPPHLQRPTDDFDIYSRRPKSHANILERRLDRAAGVDRYYVKPAFHRGTHKVMDKGPDMRRGTRDDFGIADYTRPTRKIRSVNMFGIRYAHLSERKRDAKTSLRNPVFAYRHEKDRRDLWRIRQKGKPFFGW